MITITIACDTVYDARFIQDRLGKVADHFDITISTWINPHDTYMLYDDDGEEDLERVLYIEILDPDVLSYCLKQSCDAKAMAHSLVNYSDNVIRFEYGGTTNTTEF